jgi:FixJ family two-component response regulator
MRKQALLQRLVAGLAINEGVQPKPTEIWRRLENLSPREVDVLCCVLGGKLNREIAAELSITETTVKIHRGRVMEKLVHHFRDWYSSAAVDFGWVRGARRENTRCGL